MTKLGKAIGLLLLVSAALAPSQLAFAAGFQSPHSTFRQEQDSESDNEDQSSDNQGGQPHSGGQWQSGGSQNSGKGDDEGKQFAPPPLLVKHKDLSSASSSQTLKSGKKATVIQGAVPATAAELQKAVSLRILTQDQAFAGTDFITSPVDGGSAPNGKPDGKHPLAPSGEAVDPNQNQPVVQNLGAANYEDPASEFMHKAYFGLAVLGAAAIGMTAHTIRKAKAHARSDELEFDYEVKTDA